MANIDMHPSIVDNCPGFVFPHLFMEGLSEDFEAYVPSESEKRQLIGKSLQIDGTLGDYFFGEKAEFVHSGKVRDVRRYADDSMMIRVDTFELGSDAVRESDHQLLMLVAPDGKLVRYTFMCEQFKPVNGFALHLMDCGRLASCLTPADEPKILARIRRMKVGGEMLVGPMDCIHRGFRVDRLPGPEERYSVVFFFYHPPWVFEVGPMAITQLDEMLRLYMSRGLAEIVKKYECKYYNTCSKSCLRCRTEMGIYLRLLHHRFFAEYMHDAETLALLEKVSVTECRTTPLWMHRLPGAPWAEVIDALFKNVTSSDPHDSYGGRIAPLDIRRVIVYCALEGHAAAKQWVAENLNA